MVLDKSQIYRGVMITKEAPGDVIQGQQAAETLLKELGSVTHALKEAKDKADQQYKDLSIHYNGVKADSQDLRKTVEGHTATYAEMLAKVQGLTVATDQIKRELAAPIVQGGEVLKDNDRKLAIELQKRAFVFKGGDADAFIADMENLIDFIQYRSAIRKWMKVGIETPEKIRRTFTPEETKAFEAGSLDSAIFVPEILGITIDCVITCAELLDLYNSVTVSKSSFMYPRILDYGAIGQYDCDAKCDAEFGPEGNITYNGGKTYDWRGVFCFNRKVLAEANYDLLGFMYRSAQRSYRINRNKALIQGDGNMAPEGWLTANCFVKRKTQADAVNHIDFRTFFNSTPIEYGPVTAVMHQNTFTHLATQVDGLGRFLLGDGLLTYSPDDVRERIRISNCLPDPTNNLTLGSAANPFVTGSFFCAAANWNTAYYMVEKRPLWIEQWLGKSTAWCVAYSLGAEDGGFLGCCGAGAILNVGP